MLSDNKSSCHHFCYVFRRYSVRILPGTENCHDCNRFQLDVSQGNQQILAHFDEKACDVIQRNHHSLTQELSSTGKAVPLQAWSGPEGSRKLRFPNYMTTAQDGGKVVSLTHRQPLPPGNAPGNHFC